MGIIKEEYISDKVTRHDVLPLSFLKKSAYTGSKRRLRYRMEKHQESEDAETVLRLSWWTGPFAYEKTLSQDITVSDHPFSDEGIDACIEELNRVIGEQGI